MCTGSARNHVAVERDAGEDAVGEGQRAGRRLHVRGDLDLRFAAQNDAAACPDAYPAIRRRHAQDVEFVAEQRHGTAHRIDRDSLIGNARRTEAGQQQRPICVTTAS